MNKKILYVAGIVGLLLSSQVNAVSSTTGLSVGSRSEEVKMLQEALKSDPAIYPSGLITGYFGLATEKAVKQAQRICKIPETGVVNEETKGCIYPINQGIKIVSPNGGESWDRSQMQTIKWSTVNVGNIKYPIFRKASIDLMRLNYNTTNCQNNQNGTDICITPSKYSFVRHIDTVDLFSGSYTWQIPSDVVNGSDYIVRIASSPQVILMMNAEKNNKTITYDYLATDTSSLDYPLFEEDYSDYSFSIIGSQSCPAPTCPVCPAVDNRKLLTIVNFLEELSLQLTTAVRQLKEMVK